MRWPLWGLVLLAGGCTVSEPSRDVRLLIENRSDQDLVVRIGFHEPDAGRVEKEVPVRAHLLMWPYLFNDAWDQLLRRVGRLTIEFCHAEDRSTLQRIVLTEEDLSRLEWTVVYPKP